MSAIATASRSMAFSIAFSSKHDVSEGEREKQAHEDPDQPEETAGRLHQPLVQMSFENAMGDNEGADPDRGGEGRGQEATEGRRKREQCVDHGERGEAKTIGSRRARARRRRPAVRTGQAEPS